MQKLNELLLLLLLIVKFPKIVNCATFNDFKANGMAHNLSYGSVNNDQDMKMVWYFPSTASLFSCSSSSLSLAESRQDFELLHVITSVNSIAWSTWMCVWSVWRLTLRMSNFIMISRRRHRHVLHLKWGLRDHWTWLIYEQMRLQ